MKQQSVKSNLCESTHTAVLVFTWRYGGIAMTNSGIIFQICNNIKYIATNEEMGAALYELCDE